MAPVLLADDNPATCSALRLLLSARLGLHETVTARDWLSLEALAADLQPEVILLDWELPKGPVLAGLAALRRAAPRIRLIALSARPEARVEALRAGVDAFITKGDPPDRLLDVMRGLLTIPPAGLDHFVDCV